MEGSGAKFCSLLLSKGVGEQFDFYLGSNALVENIVYCIENGHVHMPVTVDLFHALRAEISLGNHLHLHLCRFHAVALADHCAEDTVTREIGVAGDEKVAEIDRVIDSAIYKCADRRYEYYRTTCSCNYSL